MRLAFVLLLSWQLHAQPHHFVFIGMDRDQLKDTSIWTSPVLEGVQIHPKANEKVTASDIYRFATDCTHLTYIFRGTEEPYFKQQTLPFLRSL